MPKERTYIEFKQLTDTTYQVKGVPVDLTKLDFAQTLDLFALVSDLVESQQLKVERIITELQHSKNKLTGLQQLYNKLYLQQEQLAPIQTVYLKADPTVFMDLPRDVVKSVMDTGLWQLSAERITELAPL